MAIIRQYHKDTDTTYVYESISYWDAEKGQSRSKRRVIGKVDPETGEVIPTGKRGRTKKEPVPSADPAIQETRTASELKDSQKRILELELSVTALNTRIRELESEVAGYRSALEKVRALSGKIDALCGEITKT